MALGPGKAQERRRGLAMAYPKLRLDAWLATQQGSVLSNSHGRGLALPNPNRFHLNSKSTWFPVPIILLLSQVREYACQGTMEHVIVLVSIAIPCFSSSIEQ